MEQSKHLDEAFNKAIEMANMARAEFVTPEHLLAAFMLQDPFKHAFCNECGASEQGVLQAIYGYISAMEQVPQSVDYKLDVSSEMGQAMAIAYKLAESAKSDAIDVPHMVRAMLELKDCYATKLMAANINCEPKQLVGALVKTYNIDSAFEQLVEHLRVATVRTDGPQDDSDSKDEYLYLLNDTVNDLPKFVGRTDELNRCMEVLCRMRNPNVLLVGDHGVGKTALVDELTRLIVADAVPGLLHDAKVYELNIVSLMSGASYRGETERRIKTILDQLEDDEKENAIVFIDGLHQLSGQGGGDYALDVYQMLHPYMEAAKIRFIATTTFTAMSRHLSRQQALLNKFQQVKLEEMSQEDTLAILLNRRKEFEEYFNAKYDKRVLQYITEVSARHIKDRLLPEKALDLMDEAGAVAYCSVTHNDTLKIDKEAVNVALTKMTKVSSAELKATDGSLNTLSERIKAKIYGQDDAVKKVVEAVEMARAGLTDDTKPMASLLFVGPTGVGKTEVCRVLADELGVELVRFDMSEYTERHNVSKLIGSPAGYVGYEDGGLLTEAIRKTPSCVLLLDEIEKAHSDIYNILLQVMDYGKLTDNRGNKADFHSVILVMTSNAGAQHASQATVGFASTQTTGTAMLAAVKKTFKPEFINRLSGTVVFSDMDKQMARLILDKKLRELCAKLEARKVKMQLSDDAHELLLTKGYSPAYGAREMDRVLSSTLTPLLTREILYGRLRKGGTIKLSASDLT